MPVERHRVARLAGESVLRLLQQSIPLSRGKGRRLFARDGHRVRLVYFRLLAAAPKAPEPAVQQPAAFCSRRAVVLLISGLKV